MRKFLLLILASTLLVGCGSGISFGKPVSEPEPKPEPPYEVVEEKPVIYLYGYDENVNVQLAFDDNTHISVSYPEYGFDGWNVRAHSDGHVYCDNNEYRYLYYESVTKNDFNFDTGMCVAKSDLSEFLDIELTALGLNSDERNEFIVYWLQKMQQYDYCVVHFLTGEEYNVISQLNVSSKPDTEIRVYMLWYGSDSPVDINPQYVTDISDVWRGDKTVVEWGGSQVK